MIERGKGFGKFAAQAGSESELLRLERESNSSWRFADLDKLVGEIIVRALQGDRPLVNESSRDDRSPYIMRLSGLNEGQHAILTERYDRQKQQTHGTWWVPRAHKLKLGVIHYAAHMQDHPRVAHTAAKWDCHWVDLTSSPDAVFATVILEPFFERVYEPFALRGEGSGKEDENKRKIRWQQVERFLCSVRLGTETELAQIRYGCGWWGLRAAEQLARKKILLQALGEKADLSIGAFHRAYRMLPLIKRYYTRADDEGRALRKRVLTRELEVTLSGFFSGSWLEFLEYLGEEPHPDEQVVTAVPETKLYLSPTRKTAQELGVKGIDEAQLKLITASLYGGESSPIERRLTTLRNYWGIFDEIHARQAHGMPPLGDFLDECRTIDLPYLGRVSTSELRQELLPQALLREIEELWGTTMLPRFPERIVTEPHPHAAMTEAFGPALKFWHGCSLEAWKACEERDPWREMAELEDYLGHWLTTLEGAGAPVDRGLFSELDAAEKSLGPIPIRQETRAYGAHSTVTQTFAYRGEGFELLRDVITKYRRAWAKEHLGSYLDRRSKDEVRVVVDFYHEKTNERAGKPPTGKQFARDDLGTTNNWFGGDLSALYRAFGEKPPFTPERVRLIPKDVDAFVYSVYRTLGGSDETYDHYTTDDPMGDRHRRWNDNVDVAIFTNNFALCYLQLAEATGRAPTRKELGKDKFERWAKRVISENLDGSWSRFVEVVEESRRLFEGLSS